MKAVRCDAVSCWYCQCCDGWRAEVWVWPSAPSLLKFKAITEIKGDCVLDNSGKYLSASTAWVVRGGWRVAGLCVHEQWEAALCHLLQSPSLAPLTGASGGPKLFQQPMMWRMLSASPALQPAWSLWHCRGRTGPVHSEFLVVHAQCPAGPASGVSASFFFPPAQGVRSGSSENLNEPSLPPKQALESQQLHLEQSLVWDALT